MILYNKGRYGAGIVLNYSGAVIKNNIIAYNDGGQDYGGGGLWILSNGDSPVIIENNTIAENSSYVGGGGIRIWSSTVTIMNCIFWGNEASFSDQIMGSGDVTFSCIQDGYDGNGNIEADPLLTMNDNFVLNGESPCVDFGNPDEIYNDPEDPFNAGVALYPALGGLTNDMGAYGGPGTMLFPFVITSVDDLITYENNLEIIISPLPAHDNVRFQIKQVCTNAQLTIHNIEGKEVYNDKLMENACDIDLLGWKTGLYIYHVNTDKLNSTGKFIVH